MKIIYYLGPLGTFDHHAALYHKLTHSSDAKLIFMDSYASIMAKLSLEKNGSIGIMPAEGVELSDGVSKIPKGRISVKFELVLATRPGISMPEVDVVLTDKLCSERLRCFSDPPENINVLVTNFAAIAKEISQSESRHAVICTELAAKENHLSILQPRLVKTVSYLNFDVIQAS